MSSRASSSRSPLVGRRQELEAIAELFTAGERLVTLVAPPGSGKTRLAHEIARRESDAGTLAGMAELGETRTAADLARYIADELRLALDELAYEEQIGEALAARGAQLLVLDNCEYLGPEARALIDGLLERAPLARILTTSLLPLRIEGEICFELPPLSLDEAAALYEEQAHRAETAVPLERDAVETLVERLDRNPLAIRLAAARVRTLRPRQLLARIDQRLTILRGGPPGRHESLSRALRCSWDLLAAWEASALAQMAIFAGGFDLDAAEAVIDVSDFPAAPPIVEIVDELRSKVLLAGRGDPARFTLLESIRAFAWRELERAGRVDETAARHAAHYLGLARLEPGYLHGTAQIRRLRAEEENLRAVVRHYGTRDPARAAHAALALASLLESRGYAACTPELETAVANARASGDEVLVASALRALGRARGQRGELEEARTALQEAQQIARSAGAAALACHVALELAFATVQGNAPESVRPLVEEALALARSLGHIRLEGFAEQILSLIANQTGRWEDCAAHTERAIKLLRGSGALHAEAQAVINLGNTRTSLGEFDVARQLLERGRMLARQAEDPLAESMAVLNLGNLALIAGDLDQAEDLLTQARASERALGRPRFEALAAGNLATVAFARGHFHEARQLVADALITFRGTGNAFMNGVFSSVHGAILAACGELDLAEREHAIARENLQPIGDDEILRMHEVFAGFVDLARARESRGNAELHRDAARRKLTAGREGQRGGARRIASRILATALDGWTELRPVEPTAELAPAQATLVVGPEANWFEIAGTPRVEMRRRKAIRRVFYALVEQRLLSPGIGLAPEQLFAAGWPGERALPAAAAMRVYHAVKVLRQAGLEEALLRQGDGYLLEPSLPIAKRSA